MTRNAPQLGTTWAQNIVPTPLSEFAHLASTYSSQKRMTLVFALAIVATGKDRMIRTAMKMTTPPTNYDGRPRRPNLS